MGAETGAPLVLSLFPGIGLLDMAFEEEGFCVVRGPDLLWGGDVRRFHPPAGRFDGVIGGPPCPSHSSMRHAVRAQGRETAPDLIPEYERCVAAAAPAWFVMEQVPDAPVANVAGYVVRDTLVRDVWVGGVSNRLRRFSFGTRQGVVLPVEQRALHTPEPELSIVARGPQRPREYQGKRKLSRYSPSKAAIPGALLTQGLPATFFDDSPLTISGQWRAIGNGVPLPMGRAIARAVRRAMYPELTEQSA